MTAYYIKDKQEFIKNMEYLLELLKQEDNETFFDHAVVQCDYRFVDTTRVSSPIIEYVKKR